MSRKEETNGSADYIDSRETVVLRRNVRYNHNVPTTKESALAL